MTALVAQVLRVTPDPGGRGDRPLAERRAQAVVEIDEVLSITPTTAST